MCAPSTPPPPNPPSQPAATPGRAAHKADTDLPRPIVILGPTAGGKSELAVRLAEALGGEVINADSMQIYQHLDAGTAKPTPDQRARARHHLIDCAHPSVAFTVSNWLEMAENALKTLQNSALSPVLSGGTNLYLKSLLHGMFQGPGTDQAFRSSMDSIESFELHERLRAIDPPAAERIAPADRKRILRALEVHHLTGTTITELQQQWSDDPNQPYRHHPILIGLAWQPEHLNPRINLRVKAMFYPEKVDQQLAREVCLGGRSLVDETIDLENRGLLGPQAREAIGTKQVLQHLADPAKLSLEEAYEKTKIQTRRLAKQQRTWMRRFHGVHWLPVTPDSTPEQTADLALQAYRRALSEK
ncbi:tRNA (adenosine(37)-N6)-dimethylallyltransferase MiaA [Mucisphaera sp.]|uniref:tRNA (adenosine(37)-N6)-dimethylallyltransferase MiaA n=1 Tax=Mucisphaera sp. TaxID=2913024 RepID=UPI003D0ADAC0